MPVFSAAYLEIVPSATRLQNGLVSCGLTAHVIARYITVVVIAMMDGMNLSE